MQDDRGRVDVRHLRDEREPAVPERERVPGMEAAVLELVHRAERERSEVVELANPSEVEDRVAMDDALDPPQQSAEHRADEDDCAVGGRAVAARSPPKRERQRRGAGAQIETEREPDRTVHRERQGERTRDERDRPRERRGRTAAPERTGHEHAGKEQHARSERQTEPEDHSARITSSRRRSKRPRRKIQRARRA